MKQVALAMVKNQLTINNASYLSTPQTRRPPIKQKRQQAKASNHIANTQKQADQNQKREEIDKKEV